MNKLDRLSNYTGQAVYALKRSPIIRLNPLRSDYEYGLWLLEYQKNEFLPKAKAAKNVADSFNRRYTPYLIPELAKDIGARARIDRLESEYAAALQELTAVRSTLDASLKDLAKLYDNVVHKKIRLVRTNKGQAAHDLSNVINNSVTTMHMVKMAAHALLRHNVHDLPSEVPMKDRFPKFFQNNIDSATITLNALERDPFVLRGHMKNLGLNNSFN